MTVSREGAPKDAAPRRRRSDCKQRSYPCAVCGRPTRPLKPSDLTRMRWPTCGSWDCRKAILHRHRADKLSDLLTDEARFWARVEKGPGCWNWLGRSGVQHYGTVSVNGKDVGAHRYAWELHNGPVPEGRHILHHCDNPRCVRPDHLYAGTAQDNMRDMYRRGRSALQRKKGANV